MNPWRPNETTAAAFSAFAATYPNWKPSPETLRSWEWLTSDIAPADLLQAVLVHCRTSRFPPTVAELREIVAAASEPARPSPEEAWMEVQDHARNAPHFVWGSEPSEEYMRGPSWSCEDVKSAAGVLKRKGGGWPVLDDSMAADRARFIEAYRSKAQVSRMSDERESADRLVSGGGPSPMRSLLGKDALPRGGGAA